MARARLIQEMKTMDDKRMAYSYQTQPVQGGRAFDLSHNVSLREVLLMFPFRLVTVVCFLFIILTAKYG